MIIKFLAWVGFVKIREGKVHWPFKAPPRYVFKNWRSFNAYRKFWGGPYIFRNVPGVIKWYRGRLLPRRWGIGMWGFEFGDRG